jgi:hypothetical protein
MSENIEEFLKKHRFWGMNNVQKKKYPAISEKDLGEWALDRLIPWCNTLYADTPKRYRFDFDAIDEYLKDAAFQSETIGLAEYLKEFWDIALATIGKEEIKKILKKASEEK